MRHNFNAAALTVCAAWSMLSLTACGAGSGLSENPSLSTYNDKPAAESRRIIGSGVLGLVSTNSDHFTDLPSQKGQTIKINQVYSAANPDVIGPTTKSAQTIHTDLVGVSFSRSVTALSALVSVGPGSNGNEWFTEGNNPITGGSSRLAEITTGGVVTEFPDLPSQIYNNGTYTVRPGFITIGPNGNIWFTAGSFFGSVNSSGTLLSLYDVTNGTSIVDENWYGITAASDGYIYILSTTPGANSVFKVSPSNGASTVYPLPNANSDPGPQMVQASDGYIYFAAYNTSQIIRINTSGSFQAITPPLTGYHPGGSLGSVTLGPDGNLYWNEVSTSATNSYILQFVISTGTLGTVGDTARVGHIAAANGYLWFFTPGYMNKTNVTFSSITSYPLSSGLAEGFLGTGPDKNLYFISANSTITKFSTQ